MQSGAGIVLELGNGGRLETGALVGEAPPAQVSRELAAGRRGVDWSLSLW